MGCLSPGVEIPAGLRNVAENAGAGRPSFALIGTSICHETASSRPSFFGIAGRIHSAWAAHDCVPDGRRGCGALTEPGATLVPQAGPKCAAKVNKSCLTPIADRPIAGDAPTPRIPVDSAKIRLLVSLYMGE
jgi:hypothetical protein